MKLTHADYVIEDAIDARIRDLANMKHDDTDDSRLCRKCAAAWTVQMIERSRPASTEPSSSTAAQPCPECGSTDPAPYMQGDRIDHYCDNRFHDAAQQEGE